MKLDPRVWAGTATVVAFSLAGAAPSLHAQVLQTGTIAGTVRDANGQPLSGVQITIVDTGQTDVTNAHGFFATTSVLPGSHTVDASLVGYEDVRATGVVVTQELTTTVDLRLEKRTVRDAGTSRVVAPLIHKGVTPTLYTVTSKDEQLVRSQPNNLYQYPGAAISQPGVVPDANGFPTIRGSRQYQVNYMLDGIPINQPATGEFATNLVTVGMDRMNVYTGGYRAELGSAIGGVINAVVKTGASMRGQAAVEASTGTWDYSGLVYEQGAVEKSGFNWYVSGNVQRTAIKQNALASESPAIADVITKLIRPLGDKDRLTLLYTAGYQSQEVPLDDPFTGQPWEASTRHTLEFDDATGTWVRTAPTQDYLNQTHNLGSLTWAHALNPGASLSAQVYGYNRRKALNAMSDWNSIDSKTNNDVLAGKLEYAGQLGDALQLRLGTEMIQGKNWDRRVLLGQASEIGAPGSQYRIRDADTTDRNAYVSATWKPNPRLTADLGVRYDSRQYHRKITEDEIALGKATIQAADRAVLKATGMDPTYDAVAPRVGLAYLLNPKTVLKTSAGRYTQFAPASYIENRYEPLLDATGGGNPNYWAARQRKVFDVKPEKVDSVDLGVEYQINNALGLSVTPFWRHSLDMINQGADYGPDGAKLAGTAFTNIGDGHTRGVESKLTMREHNGLSGWVTYTYQKARGNNTAGLAASPLVDTDREYRLDFDQTHTIYVVGQYRKGKFEVNPMLELGSGYPWGGQTDLNTGAVEYYAASPVDGQALPILVNGKVQSLETNPYNTGWHRNLSVTFRLYTNPQKSSYYFVQVQNILNSDDVTARYWQNPVTGSNWFGYVPGDVTYTDENGQSQTANGHFEYKPWTRIPPIFVLMGVRQTF